LLENRKYDRVNSQLRCWCEGENVTVYARVGNLSEGGLFLRTNTPLERGARARLRLSSPGAHEVAAAVTVVWSRVDGCGGPPGMGLRFEPMESPIRDRLRTLIALEVAAAPAVVET
jgi:uncharacterized protein (TIGR02266 family)